MSRGFRSRGMRTGHREVPPAPLHAVETRSHPRSLLVRGRFAPPGRPRRASAVNGALAISVWVRLLKAHGLALRQVRRLVPEGLTLPQFDVLVQLHRRADGMTPGELTRALLVTAGNVTGIVSRLVAMDLAERHPVPGDRRAVRVSLTPRGRRLMRRAIPRHRRDVAALLAGVSPADLGRLRDLLGRMGRALESET